MLRKKITKHDRFFRAAMQEKRVAREFFEKRLPPAIREAVDLHALEATKETFVEENLRALLTDVLFKVPFRGIPGYLYLLVEHKSFLERLLAFKILQYIVAIMAHDLQVTGSNKLPLVYPMVLYHGKEPFTAPLDLLDLIEAPRALSEWVWRRPFQVIDLSRYSDKELKDRVWLGVMEMLLKHIHDPEILMTFLEILPALRQIEKEANGPEFLVNVLRYILSSGESQEFGKMIELSTKEFTPKTGGTVMTIAEKLREEGALKGALKAQKKMAINLLKMGFSPEVVVQASELSLEEVEALKREI